VPRAKQIGGLEVWVLTDIVPVLFASALSIFELPVWQGDPPACERAAFQPTIGWYLRSLASG
jgi:hypothetical protein